MGYSSIVSGVLNMVGRGIRHVVVVVGAPAQLLSNKAYFRIWSMETDDGIRSGKFDRNKINDAIDGMMGKKISLVPDPNMYGETVGEMVVPLGNQLVSETRGRGAPSKLFRTDKPEAGLSGTEKM